MRRSCPGATRLDFSAVLHRPAAVPAHGPAGRRQVHRRGDPGLPPVRVAQIYLLFRSPKALGSMTFWLWMSSGFRDLRAGNID